MGPVEALFQPPGLIWAGLLLAGLMALRKRAWAAGLLTLALSGFVWLLGASPVPAVLLAALERPYDRGARTNAPSADAVVMLGGAIGFSRREMLWFGTGEGADRMFTTLELARQGRVRVVVLGGAKYLWNGAQRPDNELVAAWIRAWRLPTGELHLLPICRDTHDEAVHAAALVRTRGWRSVVLVSSAYHLRRAQAAFRKAGVVTTAYGCDFLGLPESEAEDRWRLVPRPHGFHLFETWLHEVLGMAWYWWKGWI